MPLSHAPQLDPSDLKLLRLFRKIVERGGFAAAQAELNVSASTISSQMSTLESRLGMRLCDRGRVGGIRGFVCRASSARGASSACRNA